MTFREKLDKIDYQIDGVYCGDPPGVLGVFASTRLRLLKDRAKEAIVQAVLQEIPEDREWDGSEPYDNPDVAQGYNEALDELREKFSNE